MATATASRKTVSIRDYPEHLNPFREDDNHNRIRFFTLGRKLKRSDSITFSGIKTELKNSWAFRSFMKKGKKGHTPTPPPKPVTTTQDYAECSPVMFRRALQYSSMSMAASGANGSRTTIGSPERPDRYVYGGSVTPLPRSRFQERLRSPSHLEINGCARNGVSMTPHLARSEMNGSRVSVESSNPFDEHPVPPVRASRRKKKKAPLPPSVTGLDSTVADVSVTSVESETTTIHNTSELNTTTESNTKSLDVDLDDLSYNIELRIVEEEDEKRKSLETKNVDNNVDSTTLPITVQEIVENNVKKTEPDKIENTIAKTKNIEHTILNTKIITPTTNGHSEAKDNAAESNTNSKEIMKSEQNVTKHKEEIVKVVELVPEPKTKSEPRIKSEQRVKYEPKSTSGNHISDSDENIPKPYPESSILNKVDFPKVNIYQYRRNSSVNEDDIKFRKKSTEEKSSSTTRSKSLSNNLNQSHTIYDINLNEEKVDKDVNCNGPPKKVICKLYDDLPRKKSLNPSISSTEKEFIEIDRATRELEQEISKLNSALNEEDEHDVVVGNRMSVSDIRKKFDNNNVSTPNPIPKPRRTHYGSSSPINGK